MKQTKQCTAKQSLSTNLHSQSTNSNRLSTESHEDELRSELQNNCFGTYTKGRKLHQHLQHISYFMVNSNILIFIHLFAVPTILNFMHPTSSASPSADISKRNILSIKISSMLSRQDHWCAITQIVLPQCSEEKLWVHNVQQHFLLYQQGTWRSSI